MSYSDYQYPSSGTSYESYSQQYDTPQPYSSRDQHGQFVQYNYTSSPSLDQYAKPTGNVYAQSTATVLADYRGYSNPVADTGYTSTPVLSYPDSTSTHTHQYSQDTLKVDQFTARSYVPSDSASVSFSTPVPHYASGTTPQEQTSSQPVTDYSSYQYQSTDYNQPSSSYGQERSSLGYTGTYNQNSSGYSYQDTPSQLPNTWTSSTNQYTSYNTGYYGESASSTSYSQKVESGLGNTGYSPSVDRYSQSTSGDNVCGGYSQPDSYSVTDGRSGSYLGYVKPVSNQVSKPQQSFGGYASSSRFDIGSENISGSKSYNSESGGGFGVAALSSPNYSSGGGRGDFRGRDKSNVVNRGGGNRFSYAKNSSFPTQTTSTQKSFNNQSGGSSFSARSFSNQGNRDGVFSSRGSFPSANRGDRRSNVSKPPLGTFDARNKINEARSASVIQSKVATPVLAPNKNNVLVSSYKPPEATKKEVFKAPSRPQDRLLNEIEEKEKAQRAEELKKSEEEQKKAAEKRLQTLEEEKKQAEEALKKKVADEAVKAAPPIKPPETAEEIAHEEEIQRKIRESVVIISPEQETALLKDDPSQDIEMSEELRKLVKTLTTDYLCKLCSVRIVGTQMAAMHYNGKNHAKKLRNFVQTNGRSAGFNLDTLNVAGNGEQKEEVGEKKAEVVEITNNDEKRYCKVCQVSFPQESQAEMHYKGKNHAKKLKSIGTGTGPEVFECKICCVTVTAQEHLTAHLNGARHKLQVRKLDTTEIYRGGGLRGRGRGLGFRGKGRGGRGVGKVNDGDWRPLQEERPNRGTGFRGRGHTSGDLPWRGAGFKRRGGLDDGLPYRGGFGPQFSKRARF